MCLGRAGRGASQPQPAIEQSGCDARVYIVCLHVCYSSCLPLAGDCPVRSRGCTMQLRAAACANSTSRYHIGDEGKHLATKIPAHRREEGRTPALRKRTNAPSASEEKLHRCKGDLPPGRTSCLPPRRTSHACHACRKARNVKRTIRTSHACRKARNVKRTIRTSHACRKARNVKRTIRTSHACRKARNVKRTIRTSHACRKARNVKRTIRTSHACRKARNVKRTIRTSHACRKARNVKRTIRTSHACRKARNVKRTIRTSHACRKARNVKRTIRTSHACRKARNVKRTIRTSHASSCRKGSQMSHDDSET